MTVLAAMGLANGQSVQKLKEEIEQLKTENKILQNKADFCDLYSKSDQYEVQSFHKNYEMKILEVKGNKKDQTVEIVFTLKHDLPNQNLLTYNSEGIATDEFGKQYSIKEIKFSKNTSISWGHVSQIIPYDTLIQGSIIIRNVLPNIDRIKSFATYIETSNADGGGNKIKDLLEFSNLKINWK